MKILSWDAGGFVLTYKRLEQGGFRLPTFREGTLGAQLDATQLDGPAVLGREEMDAIDARHVSRTLREGLEEAR